MIYESQITYLSLDKKGNERKVKENFIIENASDFTEVETMMYNNFDGYKELDVTEIKRSKAKEIANSRSNDNERIWLAEVSDTYTKDNGEEYEIKYKIYFFASTSDKAHSFISEYLKCGYDMQLVSMKLTKFNDVL